MFDADILNGGDMNKKLGSKKLSFMLARIVDNRIAGLDVMDPHFTSAVDRLSDGCTLGLSYLIRNADLVNLALVVWKDPDCKTVFNMTRDKILDLI